METKFMRLVKLLCQWNRRDWDGREKDLLDKIWHIFEKECLKQWNKEKKEIYKTIQNAMKSL